MCTVGFRPKVRGVDRDWPRTQLSSAISHSKWVVGMKGGILVCLKQPISVWETVVLRRFTGASSSCCNGDAVSGAGTTDLIMRSERRKPRYMMYIELAIHKPFWGDC